MKKTNLRESAITLIALVVTIVVLLILAAVSISMLTGENGIISQAKDSKDKSEQSRLEEIVDLAIGSLILQNNGNISAITPQMLVDEINKTENRTDVYAENDFFPTDIIFPKEDKKVLAEIKTDTSYGGIYDEPGLEGKITPTDLFEFEIIDDISTGTTSDGLPMKTARIKRIKAEYCNSGGYNPITGKNDLTDTHYEIIYKGETISDTLVLPYQVEIDGEMYRITEANLFAIASWKNGYQSGTSMAFPKIETVIYPNTIEKIYNSKEAINFYNENKILKKVILPNNLKEIGERAFYGCVSLENIIIPDTVTKIGKNAFAFCDSLKSITIPKNVKNIEQEVFYSCTGLKDVIIADGVTSIEYWAFYGCYSLFNIKIPSSITNIDLHAFTNCETLKTIIIIRNNNSGVLEGEPWGAYNAKVIYIDSEYEKFANNYVKNKNQAQLEELFLKTNGFLGTFEEFLETVNITREEFEKSTEDIGMSYVEALKFILVYTDNEYLELEYEVYLNGGANKTEKELIELFLNKINFEGGIEEFEKLIQQEQGMSLDEFLEEACKEKGFRDKIDLLKFLVYVN